MPGISENYIAPLVEHGIVTASYTALYEGFEGKEK
jgi:hypothetical protein